MRRPPESQTQVFGHGVHARGQVDGRVGSKNHPNIIRMKMASSADLVAGQIEIVTLTYLRSNMPSFSFILVIKVSNIQSCT